MCFSLSVTGLINEDDKVVLGNNLHKLLFTIQVSGCSVCIILYMLVKFTSKKKDFNENTVERKLLLSRDIELEEEKSRTIFERSRTESIVKEVNKKLLVYEMDDRTRKLISIIFRVLQGLLSSCDDRVKISEQDLGENITYGTLIKIYYYITMNIAKLTKALETMIRDNKFSEDLIWYHIELNEYIPDDLDEYKVSKEEEMDSDESV